MIVAIGSIDVDFILHQSRMPRDGETMYGSSQIIMGGGKGANQIVAASRLGAKTAFVSVVGELDHYTDVVFKDLTWAGVSTECIEKVPGKYCGAGYGLVMEDGRNAFVIMSGANGLFTPDIVKKFEIRMTGASLIMTEYMIPEETCEYALELARERHITSLVNPSPARPTKDALYQLIDIFTPNEVEAADLCGFEVDTEQKAKDACDFFHNKGVGNVIITLGRRGALASDGRRQEMIPGYPVIALDTTGAGDSFNGAFAYASWRGYDLFTSARFANAAASISVQRTGTMQSMPTLSEVEDVFKLP
jgi:ribokinase